jgi:hypothetical protein
VEAAALIYESRHEHLSEKKRRAFAKRSLVWSNEARDQVALISRVPVAPGHRNKRVGKYVSPHAPSLGDTFHLVEGPVNAEINSALTVFLFRLRKRREAS